MNSYNEILSVFDLTHESRKVLGKCAELAVSSQITEFEPTTVKSFALDTEFQRLQHLEQLLPIESDIRQLRQQLARETKELAAWEKEIAEAKGSRPSRSELEQAATTLTAKIERMQKDLDSTVSSEEFDLYQIAEKVKAFEHMK